MTLLGGAGTPRCAVYQIGGPPEVIHIFKTDWQLCHAAGLYRENDTSVQCCWPLRLLRHLSTSLSAADGEIEPGDA